MQDHKLFSGPSGPHQRHSRQLRHLELVQPWTKPRSPPLRVGASATTTSLAVTPLQSLGTVAKVPSVAAQPRLQGGSLFSSSAYLLQLRLYTTLNRARTSLIASKVSNAASTSFWNFSTPHPYSPSECFWPPKSYSRPS